MERERVTPIGGQFLLEEEKLEQVFTPEDFTEEQRMIEKMTKDFVEGEIQPQREILEKLSYPLTVKLMRQAGELGLLSADIPEEFGGLALDKISSSLIGENVVRGGSFSLSHGAHVGIGTLPIVYFGTVSQKEKYLPLLSSGEKISAYCLTEPSSGSDALSAKTTAVLNKEGTHYILDGTKQFITNAGFADLFIVYAKVDGEKFTAFIVERGYPGVSVGPEEKKMGIKGSSTCPLNLDQVPVPVGNVLGEIGKGHQIAFNILNIGRYKLGIGTIGACKWAIEEAVVYANQRQQFQTPISRFPLIQKKIADMTIRTFVSESLTYRTGAYLEESVNKIDLTGFVVKASAKAIEEHAMEYSIAKVFGSEALDFVADEGVQIHGGYGYIAEYSIEQIYRDSRINRIFEGTNEINRLLIPSTLFKRAMQGRLPLMAKLQSLQKELISFSNEGPKGVLGEERRMVDAAKKITLFTGGTLVERFGPKLESQQELLENLSNLIITVYAMDSVLLRARKNAEKIGEDGACHQINMVQVFIRDVWGQMEKWGKEILIGCHEGDELWTRLTILKKMLRANPVNTIQLKRKIAEKIIKDKKYNSL